MLQTIITFASLSVICGRVWALPPCTRSAAPTVTLDEATVTGIYSENVSQFLGIPYAQPPVGNLRLQVPQPLPPYTSNFDATTPGPSCPQLAQPVQAAIYGHVKEPFAHATYDSITSPEDCLTLNVITPSTTKPTDELPVVVWIYGGAFQTGSTSQYDGGVIVNTAIKLQMPIIYVAMNYRLNILGFLAGEEIRRAGVGNLGLRDQHLALEWVQKYIHAFGGDPTKVTIWGESAGAMSVGFQMLNNSGEAGEPGGLFRAAFMQSGSPTNWGNMSSPQPAYDALVSYTNCTQSTDRLQCLREVPYETLMDALSTSPELALDGIKNPYCPRIDEDFLKGNPYDLIRKGSITNVPFVTGDCDDEGTVFSIVTAFDVVTDDEFGEYLRTKWMANSSPSVVKGVMELYPSNPYLGSPFDTSYFQALAPQYKRLSAFNGDLIFQAPRRFLLKTLSARQNTWTFLSKRLKSTPFVGAYHSSDLLNVYDCGDMASYLVRFVTNLDPNVGESTDINWPQYTLAGRSMLEFLDGNTNTSYVPAARVASGLGLDSAQIPLHDPTSVQVAVSSKIQPTLAVTTDTFREAEIEYLFQIAEANPF